jgi:type IV secretion system protein VirB4
MTRQEPRSGRALYGHPENTAAGGETRPFVAMAKMDLSGMGKFTRLLSGSEDNLKIFDAIYQDGMRPDEWKAAFLDRAI